MLRVAHSDFEDHIPVVPISIFTFGLLRTIYQRRFKMQRIMKTINSDYQHYVFNIKGKRYRLVVVIRFRMGYVFIRFVGTHAEYGRIDCATI